MSTATAELPLLRITFGADTGGVFDAGLPVLAGETVEDLFGAGRAAGRAGPLSLFAAGDWLLGAATVPAGAGLEQAAHELYRHIFAAAQGRQLARIWNYVPAINETGAGLENYRAFCRGRSLAFEQHYGREFKVLLPSASAVGSKSGALTVAFAACPGHPRHVENPLQVPAYDYPPDYGPRAPSFARATVVAGPASATVFISGTAAIRGHGTVAPHHLGPQLDCALENLAAISGACGLGANLAADSGASRHFKVYVRHAADHPAVARVLQERLLVEGDRVSYIQADICRAALLVEIEASLFGVAVPR
jgi:chorismate lyase/3-hydroxybenzoate synthase